MTWQITFVRFDFTDFVETQIKNPVNFMHIWTTTDVKKTFFGRISV